MNAPAKLNEAQINAAACQHFWDVLLYVIDQRGRPTADVAALNPASQPRKLALWRILNDDVGSWRSQEGDAGSGPDLVSLIAHLADVERPAAAELLASFVERARIERRYAESVRGAAA